MKMQTLYSVRVLRLSVHTHLSNRTFTAERLPSFGSRCFLPLHYFIHAIPFRI